MALAKTFVTGFGERESAAKPSDTFTKYQVSWRFHSERSPTHAKCSEETTVFKVQDLAEQALGKLLGRENVCRAFIEKVVVNRETEEETKKVY